MDKILNKAEAKAVYDAMCSLNNVNGQITFGITLDNTQARHITVFENNEGVFVFLNNGINIESYISQDSFQQAYGLDL